MKFQAYIKVVVRQLHKVEIEAEDLDEAREIAEEWDDFDDTTLDEIIGIVESAVEGDIREIEE